MKQVALALQKSVFGIGQIARDWFIHNPFALAEMPAICTRRVDNSMKNRTTKR
jgi:hypothetical protein